MIFLLAIAFIFLVLAAQFESWVDPFVILLAVPLAAFGAFLFLNLANWGTRLGLWHAPGPGTSTARSASSRSSA